MLVAGITEDDAAPAQRRPICFVMWGGACLGLVCVTVEAAFVFDSLAFVKILIKIMAVVPGFAALFSTGSSLTFGRSSVRSCVASTSSSTGLLA